MRYVLIRSDGVCDVTGGDETAWLEDIGPEGPVRVPLGPLPDLPPITGWVNSAGAASYPANPIGGKTLANLGGTAADYFGPVLVTGWDGTNARGINSLQSAQITAAYDEAVQSGG